jgi:cytochrome d ubiquinol oxidase subunit II
MLDYPTLRFLCWLLTGVLLIGFAIMDGHDLGIGALLPWLARNDNQRRVLLNTIGPHWDGNQVWLVSAAGMLFAAWPLVYATAFSTMYWVMMAALWALFLRPVGFDFRSKLENRRWRAFWDACLFISGAFPPLLFGIAFGNLFLGLPFSLDNTLRVEYSGGFWSCWQPFALLCGLLALCMAIFQAACFLMIKTLGGLRRRARRAACVAGVLCAALFMLAGVWLSRLHGLVLLSGADPHASSDPLAKAVFSAQGAWLYNYERWPWLWLLPLLGVTAALGGALCARQARALPAFWLSSLTQAGIIATAGAGLFPFMLPSSLNPDSSLTLWDASSSQLTLNILFWAALLLTPLVVCYTRWCYRVMRGPVTAQQIRRHTKSVY